MYPRRDLSRVVSIDIHYTASPSTVSLRSVAAYQVGPDAQERFPAIAYHIVVDGSGDVYLCNGLDRRVWHNGASGRNEVAIGICYIGNMQPSNVQLEGMRKAIRWCERTLRRQLTIQGHKDTYATACPGPRWPLWKERLR